ncbi:MAG: hypothetical protein DMF84_23375 [Acidobacteria bacterium]|nr:MAG: hypothetical protein DMF84_23375 [Acidobacteriota bacterium]
MVDAMELQSACDASLRFAIENKRLVCFLYNSKWRVAEPHDYGVKHGASRLLVYQVRGESSGIVRGWKLLDTAKIDQLAVLEATFRGTRGRPDQHHIHWDELFARVR